MNKLLEDFDLTLSDGGFDDIDLDKLIDQVTPSPTQGLTQPNNPPTNGRLKPL